MKFLKKLGLTIPAIVAIILDVVLLVQVIGIAGEYYTTKYVKGFDGRDYEFPYMTWDGLNIPSAWVVHIVLSLILLISLFLLDRFKWIELIDKIIIFCLVGMPFLYKLGVLFDAGIDSDCWSIEGHDHLFRYVGHQVRGLIIVDILLVLSFILVSKKQKKGE